MGPTGVCVARAEGAVGDAVAKGDDGGAFPAGHDVDALEKWPGVDLPGGLQCLRADDVTGRDVVGLVGEAVVRDLLHRLRRDEEADRQIAEGRELEVGRIADYRGSGGNGDGGTAAEGEGGGGGEVGLAARASQRGGGCGAGE